MILVRHGQSEFNVIYNRTGRDPGIRDPHLTEFGREQVRKAARSLRERPLKRVLTSPYTRALQTAEIIARELRLPIEVEPMVREHALFQCDIGTPRSRLAETWPALSFDHLEESWWPLEESEHALLERCADFHARAAKFPDWREVAVVSHWGFILRLTGYQAANAELVPFDPTQPCRFRPRVIG